MAHKPTKQTTSPILFFHADVFTTSACLKHSNFLRVKVLHAAPHNEVQIQSSEKMPIQMLTRKGGPTVLGRTPTTSFKKRNNFNFRHWSWNYRGGCWHQTCPSIDTHKEIINFTHSSYKTWMPCIVISCHYLPVSGLCNLRSYCLP